MQTYTGSKSATQAPSGAPVSGSAPIVNLPQDGIDAVSASTVTQAEKVNADYITYIQKSINCQPAFTPDPATVLNPGFTAFTHTGSGSASGCILDLASIYENPSGTISQSSASTSAYVITITTGGATGTAKFSVSIDGGNTLISTNQTTAASYFCNGGVYLIFSGTFVLNDTWSFRATDTPMGSYINYSNEPQQTIDHNGFISNSVWQHQENWIGNVSTFTSADAWANLTNITSWQGYTHSTNANIVQQISVGAPYQCLALHCGTANGSYSQIRSSTGLINPAHIPNTYLPTISFETVVIPHMSGAWIMNVGLQDSGGTYYMWLTANSSSAFWRPQVNTTDVIAQSGGAVVAVSSDTLYRIRIEINQYTSIRMFVNDQLLATFDGTTADTAFYPQFYFASGDTTTNRYLNIGQTKLSIGYCG